MSRLSNRDVCELLGSTCCHWLTGGELACVTRSFVFRKSERFVGSIQWFMTVWMPKKNVVDDGKCGAVMAGRGGD